MWIHRISGFIMFNLTFGFVLKMVAGFGWEIAKDWPHAVIGAIVLSSVGVVMAGGIISKSMMNR